MKLFLCLAILLTVLPFTALGYNFQLPEQANKACASLLNDIAALIDESSRCERRENCTTIGLGCPFGCSTPINKTADQRDITTLYARYANNPDCLQCLYGCAPVKEVLCVKGRCVFDPSPVKNPSYD